MANALKRNMSVLSAPYQELFDAHSPVPLFHSLGGGTVEQALDQSNSAWNRGGTSPLKSSALSSYKTINENWQYTKKTLADVKTDSMFWETKEVTVSDTKPRSKR
jgi:hypothetical protein